MVSESFAMQFAALTWAILIAQAAYDRLRGVLSNMNRYVQSVIVLCDAQYWPT